MKTYDVVIEVRVRANSESEAVEQAFEVLNSPAVKDVKVEVFNIKPITER